MSRNESARRNRSTALVAIVAALAIAVGGFVVGRATTHSGTSRFKNTAATRPAPTTASTSATAPGPTSPASTAATWSLVRDPEGGLRVVRGSPARGLRPNTVEASGATVLSVETDIPERTLATAPTEAAAVENDPMRSQQWALNQTSFERAWSATRGAGVVVAVVDTGVDAAHRDLGSVVLPGIDYISSAHDGRYDGNGHGTHVAGVIAAQVNNGVGIAGAAPSVRILPVRVLDGSGSGVSSNVAAGIIWAADHGAQVINLSLGGGVSPALQIAMQYALRKGAVVVAAAGNNGASGNDPVYPGAYPEAIAVGAFDSHLARASFSNTGTYVDVSAPGDTILSTWPAPQSSYALLSGTSMATPYASAEVALIRSVNRALTPAAVTSILESTARPAGRVGTDTEFGHGLIDPATAVLAARPKVAGYGTKGTGYWIVAPSGGVRSYGSAQLYGTASSGGSPVVASARTATGRGYWLVAANGAVYAFGDARSYGGMNRVVLNAAIVGMASTPTGRGYILLAADGGIFTFGDAHFYGSTGGRRLNARVLDLALTTSGRGYWFVAADGGVFSFGDAHFHGSTGAMKLSAPVTSMASASNGRGYWLVASDGGIFAFDVPFEGSLPSTRALTGGSYAPTMRMRAVGSSDGYYLLGLDGSVASFGTARFFGSAAPHGAVDFMLSR
jgi:type VII secretion-associated serine protease mycosin